MGETTDYTLIKLDKIEDLVREVKQLLLDGRNSPPPPAVPGAALGLIGRMEGWVFSIRPLLLGAKVLVQHILGIVTIWMLIQSGSPQAADPYIRWLLGV